MMESAAGIADGWPDCEGILPDPGALLTTPSADHSISSSGPRKLGEFPHPP